jgi:transposase
MRGDKLLSAKEARRVSVMEDFMKKKINAEEAALLLGVSDRHIYRLKEAMKEEGIFGLAHKSRGRKAHNRTPDEIREYVIELATGLAKGGSCKHISEIAREDKEYHISSKTVGRILEEAGIENVHSHKAPKDKHQTRERMPMKGLLVQFDASPFEWLGPKEGMLNLHGAIDDATSIVLSLWLEKEETSNGYLHVTKDMLENYGVPRSIYSDGHGIFFPVNQKRLSIEDELEGRRKSQSQFGRIMESLGIIQIKALSAQAKGRIERLWETLQHRLVIEFRRNDITSIKDANAFLSVYMDKHNIMFAKKPRLEESSFRACPSQEELERLLAKEYDRKPDRGSVISFNNKKYQVTDRHDKVVSFKPRSTLKVLIHMDGHLSARKNDNYYNLKEVKQNPPMVETHQDKMKANDKVTETPKWRPSMDHPWRVYRDKTESGKKVQYEEVIDTINTNI